MQNEVEAGKQSHLKAVHLASPAKQELTSRTSYSYGTESVYTSYSNTISEDMCYPGLHTSPKVADCDLRMMPSSSRYWPRD